MPLLTPAQIEQIGLPPRPLIPQQRIANPDGTPTFEYNLFLTVQYEWERRLLAALSGAVYPRPASDVPPPAPPLFDHQVQYFARVTAAGAITGPAGVTCAKTATGRYRITHPTLPLANREILLTVVDTAAGLPGYAVLAAQTTTTFDVYTFRETGVARDTAFAFLVASPVR